MSGDVGLTPLGPDDLTASIDLSGLKFTSTRDVEGIRTQIGEDRAMSALRLGIRLRAPGYNVFVAGLEGPRQQEQIRNLILKEVGDLPTPGDIVYLHNFDDPDCPRALILEAGDGRRLRKEMEELIETLRREIPESLKKESFEKEREHITSTYDKELKELFKQYQEAAKEKGVLVRMSPEGQMIFVPLKEDGEPVADQEEYEKLPVEKKKELTKNREEVQRGARELLKRQQAISKKVRDEVEAAVKKFAAEIVAPLIEGIAERIKNDGVREHLRKVEASILDNLDDFQEQEEQPSPFPFPMPKLSTKERFLPYQVNLIVDNSDRNRAPIIVQDSPTYQNLFGSIERIVDQTGKLVTNFTRIKAGDLLRANGGFLVFDLDDALTELLVWKILKRTLKSGRLEIESQNPFAFITVSGMVPEPIEVQTRLIVTGSRYAFSLLSAYDPEFRDIFKVVADFAPEENRDRDVEKSYLQRVAHLVEEEKLKHFTREGVEELLLFGIRRAGDQGKLSAQLHEVDDLVREASLIAEERGLEMADADSVRAAIESRTFRANWIEERSRELIDEGTILIKVEGEEVGQINALTVLFFGGYSFGRPARLTASVSMGGAGIVNIEREAKLSGSIHDKGVLIIAGFLRNRFGRDKPLSFSASLCFEQSYSGVEGDSASAAELYALLSRIGNIPLRQDLAVTGSVNQRGEIQAIGGVNEKVEGFYRTCQKVGLTGTQGVLIPASNVSNLVLHPEVIAAVREGTFHVYPVRTVEEGMEMLTGLPAGKPGEEGTVMGIVDRSLLEMAKALKAFGRPEKEEKDDTNEDNEE